MFSAPGGLIATTMQSAPRAALCRAGSVAAAVAALAEPGAMAVAGGTDLCARYNAGARPGLLVCLERLDALRCIAVGAGEIRIGALVPHAQGSGDAGLRAALPGFAAAWAMIANPRVRFRGTIGGNLMAGRTRYEMPLLLAALGATLHFAGGDGMTAQGPLAPPPAGALLHHVTIPRHRGQRFIYMRGLRPRLTLALHRHAGGGLAAIGTEHLRPVTLAPEDAALHGLPEAFADHEISHWYARRAGATLLRRGMEALDAA